MSDLGQRSPDRIRRNNHWGTRQRNYRNNHRINRYRTYRNNPRVTPTWGRRYRRRNNLTNRNSQKGHRNNLTNHNRRKGNRNKLTDRNRRRGNCSKPKNLTNHNSHRRQTGGKLPRTNNPKPTKGNRQTRTNERSNQARADVSAPAEVEEGEEGLRPV